MAFQKGQSGNPNGRKPGQLNGHTITAKRAIQDVFEGMGGVEAMQTWASANPTEFYKHYAKLIPVEVDAKGDISLTIVSGVPRAE